MKTYFKLGEVVHCEGLRPFNNIDGVVKKIVLRDKYWSYREKYLIEIEYKNIFGYIITKNEWFTGTGLLAKIIN